MQSSLNCQMSRTDTLWWELTIHAKSSGCRAGDDDCGLGVGVLVIRVRVIGSAPLERVTCADISYTRTGSGNVVTRWDVSAAAPNRLDRERRTDERIGL